MRAKLMVEVKGRAREEVRLESAIPLDLKLLENWTKTWISQKEFKQWSKQDWPVSTLGELIEGRILKSVFETPKGLKSTGGSIFTVRLLISDGAGGRRKLPMLLYGRVKNKVKLDYFKESMDISPDEEKFLKKLLKSDLWAPLSVWHYGPANAHDKNKMTELLDLISKITRSLFHSDFKGCDWNVVETQYYRK